MLLPSELTEVLSSTGSVVPAGIVTSRYFGRGSRAAPSALATSAGAVADPVDSTGAPVDAGRGDAGATVSGAERRDLGARHRCPSAITILDDHMLRLDFDESAGDLDAVLFLERHDTARLDLQRRAFA